MKQCVIYTRVSSDEQVNGMSLDFQQEDCLAYARNRDMTVALVFEERGESAKFADRPKLIALIDYCRHHKKQVKALLVWKLDRLARNQLDYYYLKRTLLDLGIAIHSATEPTMEDGNSVAAKIFETFSALQAEIDNTIRSERTKRGMASRIAMGIWPWKPPLGYLPDRKRTREDKKRTPDLPHPEIFPLLQEGLRRYASGTLTPKQLLAYLDQEGLSQLRGRRTHPQMVWMILHRYLPYYAGYLLNPWSGETIAGLHQPMLSETEYRTILARRDHTLGLVQSRSQRNNPRYPLRGIVICAECDHFLTASTSHGRGGYYRYYHCCHKSCPSYGKSNPAEPLEAAFAQMVRPLRLPDHCFAVLFKIVETEFSTHCSRRSQTQISYQQQKIRLNQQLEAIHNLRENGEYDSETYHQRKDRLLTELAAVESALNRIGISVLPLNELRQKAKGLVDNPWKIIQSWDQIDQLHIYKLLLPQGIRYHRPSGFLPLTQEDLATDQATLTPLAKIIIDQFEKPETKG